MLAAPLIHVEVRIHLVVVPDHCGIEIREGNQHRQDHQHYHIDLLAEEHAEHALPVGIARRGDSLRGQFVIIDAGEQLLVRQIVFPAEIFHCAHLAFSVKEILGSTVAITTSPRIRDSTDSTV